jgi:tetratricopeptide (TPR) repeat protein
LLAGRIGAPLLLNAFVAIAAAAAAPAAQAAGAPALPSDAAKAAVVTGEAFERQRDFEGAYSAYRAGLAQDSTSYDLWWRCARTCSDRGQRADFDKKKPEAEAAYAEAVRAARKAVALSPDGWEGHLELAVALGRLALFRGGGEKLKLSKELKVEADRALGLNPQADRAYHVLARWNRGIAQLSFFEKAGAKVIYGGVPAGASMDQAVTFFEKAVELRPDWINHRLELGRTYLDMGLKSKAREQFEKALALPIEGPFDADYKMEAQRLLAKAK